VARREVKSPDRILKYAVGVAVPVRHGSLQKSAGSGPKVEKLQTVQKLGRDKARKR
jgi:hypothetical protein